MKTIKIQDRLIGGGNPAYLIAEIGSNHNQDLSLAIEMIGMAKDAGADAVKFQSIKFEKIYSRKIESDEFKEWFSQIELSESWYSDLANEAKRQNIHFLSSPTYIDAIPLLTQVNVPAMKIASPQVQGNLSLLSQAAKTGLPLILSMGYSDYGDIARAIKICEECDNKNLILLHCVAKYPTEPYEAKLRFINTLQAMSGYPVGFSDHTLGAHMAIAAVALGACVIEKHVTISRDSIGPDHHFALMFKEFKDMATQIREVESSLIDATRMELTREELILRDSVMLKIVTTRSVFAGETVSFENIKWIRVKSHGGIGINEIGSLDRYVFRKDMPEDMVIAWTDLQLI
jgi:sialic acid synthase SpsE